MLVLIHHSTLPVNAVTHISKALSEKFVNVMIAANHPMKCHPSKQATCKWKAEPEKAEIQLTIAS